MAIASNPDHLAIHPATIIPDRDAQISRHIIHHHFNLAGIGVAKRIDDRLTHNPVDLALNDRAHRPGLALGNHSKIDILGQGKFLSDPRERLFQVVGIGQRRTKRSQGVAPLLTHLLHQTDDSFDERLGGRVLG